MEKFCLRWSEFGANVTHSFGDLRKKGQLFDVTISTDDDDDSNTANLLAHKGPFTYDIPPPCHCRTHATYMYTLFCPVRVEVGSGKLRSSVESTLGRNFTPPTSTLTG